MPPRSCVVTGATGFLGSHLCERLAHEGWSVRALARDPSSHSFTASDITVYHCDLPDDVDEAAFDGADVVIHCAYMSRHTTFEEARRVNEEGSARVLALAREAEARFVFISSTGAHEEALSYYGRSKLAIEGTLELDRDLIIRPGLILGEGGLFARISESLDRFGFLPVFDGGRQRIQTIHVDDLCTAILSAVVRGLTGCYVVAEPEGLSLRELFLQMAARKGRRARLISLPARPVLTGLRAAERLGLTLPLTSENVLGALSLRTRPSAADLARLGVTVRTATESLDHLLQAEESVG